VLIDGINERWKLLIEERKMERRKKEEKAGEVLVARYICPSVNSRPAVCQRAPPSVDAMRAAR